MRVFLSDSVKALNIPPAAIKATVEAAVKPPGPEGKIFYQPATLVLGDGTKVDIVVVRYLKPNPLQGAKRGDGALYLESEWDGVKNPLG